MNREIKFRAYDKEDERMTYFDDEDYLYHCPFILRLEQVFKKDSNYDDYEDFEYKDVTDKIELMQYTGLHDKNGKEIYEGDIVLLTCYNYEEPVFGGEFKVIYDDINGMWLLVDLENKDKGFTFGEIRSYYKAEFEVIGNVFEKGILLNDSEKSKKN